MKLILTLALALSPLSLLAQATFGSPSYVASFTSAGTTAPSFSYTSTAFNGSSYVYGNPLTGIADNKQGTISFWMKLDGGNGTSMDVIGAADTAVTRTVFRVIRQANNTIRILCNATTGANLYLTDSTSTVTTSSGWVHVFSSWNMANGAQHCFLINGVSVDGLSSYVDGNISWATGTPLYAVGGYRPDPHPLNGKLCEVWFTTTYIPASDVTKFRTVGGKPENLGADGSTPTGSQPILYLPNPYSTFSVNAGSGGNFPSTQGTLADGGADKP